MSHPSLSNKDFLLSIVIISFVFGLLALAFLYEDGRVVFFDLSKVVLGAYVGYWIPSPRQ
ncbi:hypothetical protein IQ277_27160 [Nostocales cyanobacterium LEGE 12452]|nr:hypothetical protein [Nostocales cyanobacterium LEGE 12452]